MIVYNSAGLLNGSTLQACESSVIHQSLAPHPYPKEQPVDHANQRVADWMTSDPLTAAPDLSASEAYERMRQRGVRRMPVLDATGVLVGILTRSDIEAAVALPRDDSGWRSARFALTGTVIADLMTSNPVTVEADAPIAAAAAAMIQARVSGLPVLRDDNVVGIITESDIFRLVVAGWSGDGETNEQGK